jgi:hypothetical protein
MNRVASEKTASSPRPSPPLEEEREFNAPLRLFMVTTRVFKTWKLSMNRRVTLRQSEPESEPDLQANARLSMNWIASEKTASSPQPSPPLEEEREFSAHVTKLKHI